MTRRVNVVYLPRYLPSCQALIFVADTFPEEDPFATGTHVFVCGGLQDPTRVTGVLGRRAPFAPAVAVGFRRMSADIEGRTVPFMVPDPDDPHRPLTGVVWLGLLDAEVRQIEEIELAGGHRRRIVVRVTVGERTVDALTYVRR